MQSMTAFSGKLFNKIKRLTGSAIGDFDLIEEGDNIAVAVSGGKDSYVLLHILEELRRRAPVSFRLTAVNIDIGFPGYRTDIIEEHLQAHGFDYRMVPTECFRIIEQKRTPGSSFCAFCARLRRGVLYTQAQELGCNKIALGHHRDDSLETLLMNLFYAGKMQAMPAVYTTDDGRFKVIRPLIECPEERIAELAEELAFPILPCNLCGSQEGLKREATKALLAQLEATKPDIKSVMMRAIGNVRPTHLMDKDVLAAWEKRPDDVRRDGDLKPGPKRSAAEPVKRGGPRLPVIG